MALQKRRVPDAAATEVLDRLEQVGLIDDQRFAAMSFENQRRRQRSTRALRNELRTKGVDAEIIDDVALGVSPETDEQVARQLVAKRLPAMMRLPAEVRRRRLAGQLARRGFNAGVIGTVLRDLPADPTDWVDEF